MTPPPRSRGTSPFEWGGFGNLCRFRRRRTSMDDGRTLAAVRPKSIPSPTRGDRHGSIHADAAPGPELQRGPAAREDDGDDPALHGLGATPCARRASMAGGEKLTAERRPPHQGQGRQAGRQRRPLCRGQGRDRRLLRPRGQGSRRGRGDRPGLPASVRWRRPTGPSCGRSRTWPRSAPPRADAWNTGPPARRFARPRFGEPAGRRPWRGGSAPAASPSPRMPSSMR